MGISERTAHQRSSNRVGPLCPNNHPANTSPVNANKSFSDHLLTVSDSILYSPSDIVMTKFLLWAFFRFCSQQLQAR
jgi:hypothetical protein